MRTPITSQPHSVAAALSTQKEQAVCDVIAYQGSQALIQYQAGLVLLGGCKASQEPLSCKLASISALTSALHQTHLHAPLCCDGNIYLSSMHNSKHDTQTTLACLHTRTHACMRTRSASACLHTLVRLCYGHKHRARTSCGTCILASNECG